MSQTDLSDVMFHDVILMSATWSRTGRGQAAAQQTKLWETIAHLGRKRPGLRKSLVEVASRGIDGLGRGAGEWRSGLEARRASEDRRSQHSVKPHTHDRPEKRGGLRELTAFFALGTALTLGAALVFFCDDPPASS